MLSSLHGVFLEHRKDVQLNPSSPNTTNNVLVNSFDLSLQFPF